MSTYVRPMAFKLSRMMTEDEGTTPTKSSGHVTNKKLYISIFTRPTYPKRRRVVT